MKKYRGWVIALLLILLCIGGVRLVLRATAEYPALGEPVSYPVNQLWISLSDCSPGRKKTLPSRCMGRERFIASWCHPSSARRGALLCSCYGERAVDVSIPARKLSSHSPAAARSQPMARLSAVRRTLRYSCLVLAVFPAIYCMGFLPECQAVKGVVLGLTMLRQSRSPRARPRMSISAEARLLA